MAYTESDVFRKKSKKTTFLQKVKKNTNFSLFGHPICPPARSSSTQISIDFGVPADPDFNRLLSRIWAGIPANWQSEKTAFPSQFNSIVRNDRFSIANQSKITSILELKSVDFIAPNQLKICHIFNHFLGLKSIDFLDQKSDLILIAFLIENQSEKLAFFQSKK